MIEGIARNDYGEGVEEHFAGIQEQLSSNPPLGLLAWNPREILELERSSEPDERHRDCPPTGAYGHTKRLLACAILLRNVGRVRVTSRLSDEAFFVETSASTAIQLVRSALAIGGEAPELAAQLLLRVYEVQIIHRFVPLPLLALCSSRQPGTVCRAIPVPLSAPGYSQSRLNVVSKWAGMWRRTAG